MDNISAEKKERARSWRRKELVDGGKQKRSASKGN